MLKLVLAVRTLPVFAPALPAATAPALPPLSLPAAAPALAPALALVERRGIEEHGREVVVLDLVDRAAPEAGTAAHVDFSMREGQASLDGPLDSWVDPRLRTENLSHFRPHLWFGLAVRPEYQGQGLGTRLLDEAVARMREAGVRELYLRATETSRDFYLKRFGARVRSVAAEDDGEGGTYYRLEIDLR